MRQAAQPVDIDFSFPNGASESGPFPVLHGANLSIWLDATGTGAGTIYNFFNTGVIRYWYYQNPAATDQEVRDFDYHEYVDRIMEIADQYDATDPDIDRFVKGGGKLLMVQGSVDMLVPPSATNPYYESLLDRYGRQLRRFVRYYTQPGYGHGNGDFNLSWDSLTALDRWVTSDAAPTRQVAYDGNVATAARSMPLCEYPKWPLLTGAGNPNVASSYTCVDDATALASRIRLTASSWIHTPFEPVTLTATVHSLRAAEGTVVFRDRDVVVAEAPVVDGYATYTLPADLRVGIHRYTASFLPANDAILDRSSSRAVYVLALPARRVP